MTDLKVINRAERGRYELLADGLLAGYAEYVETADAVRFVHTETLPEHAGKGYGGRLAAAAVGDVRRQGKQIVADCGFMAAYLKKNPDGGGDGLAAPKPGA